MTPEKEYHVPRPALTPHAGTLSEVAPTVVPEVDDPNVIGIAFTQASFTGCASASAATKSKATSGRSLSKRA